MSYPVRMTHPQHGAMHVYNKADAEKLTKRGWELETPAEPVVEAKRKYTKKAKA